MSSPLTQPRIALRRLGEATSQRARLSSVPTSVNTMPRTGFVALVVTVLALGVVGLLMFNTFMQQTSFTATKLDKEAARLAAVQQGLELDLANLRDPQQVALAARRLGMVQPPAPAFLRLTDGKVLGTPMPATGGDFMRVTPLPLDRPQQLIPEREIVKVELTKAQLARLKRDRLRAEQERARAGADAPPSGGRR